MAQIDEIIAAHQDVSMPNLYINGFTIGLGTTDATIILKLNNRSVMVLNVPYTTAKTLAEKLGALIANFEDATDTRILTTDQINEVLSSVNEEEE